SVAAKSEKLDEAPGQSTVRQHDERRNPNSPPRQTDSNGARDNRDAANGPIRTSDGTEWEVKTGVGIPERGFGGSLLQRRTDLPRTELPATDSSQPATLPEYRDKALDGGRE